MKTVVSHLDKDFPENLIAKMNARFNGAFHFDPDNPRIITLDVQISEVIIRTVLKGENISVSYSKS